jgi:IrrE N-terminal-like domain
MHTSPAMLKAISAARTVADLVSAQPGGSALLDKYPRDMAAILQQGLEVPVVEMADLTVRTSADYLCILRGDPTPLELQTRDRLLMGLFYAGPPCSVVFIQEGLAPQIRNYVLAHELGHFIVDVFLVRQLWLRSLPEQRDAIQCAFAWHEMDDYLEMAALFRGLPSRPRAIIGRESHATTETADREIQADLIARELLAPWGDVAAQFLPGKTNRRDMLALLHEHYGLPLKIAAYYCNDLQLYLAPKPSLTDRLFAPLLSDDGQNGDAR